MTVLQSQRRRDLEHPVETGQRRTARLAAESSMLAVVEADLQKGRAIGDDDLDAWLAGWERGDDVRLPDEPIAAPKR